MLAIVERVQRVVGRAGMLGFLLQDRERDAARLERDRQVALARRDSRQQRQRVERRRLIVFGKLAT